MCSIENKLLLPTYLETYLKKIFYKVEWKNCDRCNFNPQLKRNTERERERYYDNLLIFNVVISSTIQMSGLNMDDLKNLGLPRDAQIALRSKLDQINR